MCHLLLLNPAEYRLLPIQPMAQLDPVLENLCSLLNTRSLLQTHVYYKRLAFVVNMRQWMLFIHFVFLFIWDGVHCLEMLCYLLNIRRWTESRNIFFCIEKHTNWQSEYRNFAHFIEYERMSKFQKPLALYWTKDGRQNSCFFSRRLWTGSRNFILVVEHEKFGWVQKLNILYWTRDGWQSPKTSCPLFNTNRWSEWRNFESFIKHKTMVRVQKLGVLYWAENYGPCKGNVTSYDSSYYLTGHCNYKTTNRCVILFSSLWARHRISFSVY